MLFNIYTDGSCRRNGMSNARGAWGYVILDVEFKKIIDEDCHTARGTTNQRMEMEAVIHACSRVSLSMHMGFDEAYVYTDSAYIHNCLTQKWYEKWRINGWMTGNKKPVANKDLWEQLILFFEDPRFHFFKVDGHQGVKWNEYVDKMVQKASQES